MVFLKALFIVIEVFCCLMLIGLILMQKSKSEGLGMAFGAGAGESLFGARAGNVLSKATRWLAVVFIASTLILGWLYAQRDRSLMDQMETDPVQPVNVQPQQPADAMDVELPGTDVLPIQTMDDTAPAVTNM